MNGDADNSRTMRVLVVDDEASIRSIVQRFLARGGTYEVDVAEDAQRALRLLGDESYDVIVSDIVLPGMSGVALLRAIREESPDVQVIMMTGEPTVDTATEAIRAGACNYLTKPVGRESLLHAVDRAARMKALIDDKKRVDAENRQYREHLEELVERRSAALARSERRLRTILDHMQTGIFVMDAESRTILDVNPVAADMLDVDADAIVGQDGERFIGDPSPDASSPRAGERARASINQETTIITGSGKRRPVLKTVVPVELEGRPCFVESFVDISAQKETEGRLREARELAERTSRAKSELLANVSHELRTPLNGILGMADLALDEPLDQELRDSLETIRESGHTLLTTLSHLAELAEAGMASPDDAEIDEFHPLELARGAVERIRDTARDKDLEVDVEATEEFPVWCGDTRRIERILDCLLDNAVKFTDQGRVAVRVASMPGEPPGLQFSVLDTGCGIPQEKQATIFEPFTMADASSARRHGGLGLGLALAQRLADIIEADLSVTSTDGEGCCFSLTLPALEGGSSEVSSP